MARDAPIAQNLVLTPLSPDIFTSYSILIGKCIKLGYQSSGWELLEIRGPMDGLLAYEWEQSILKLLRKKGADLGNSTVAGTFDGYTESWVASSFPVKSIKELMQLVQEDEDNPTEKSLGGGSDSLGLSC